MWHATTTRVENPLVVTGSDVHVRSATHVSVAVTT
jgi:hypothetical protein